MVSSLSNRMFTEHIDPAEDRIHKQKMTNGIKILEPDGRPEDLSQLSRKLVKRGAVVAYKPAWGWLHQWGSTIITMEKFWPGLMVLVVQLFNSLHLLVHSEIKNGEDDVEPLSRR